MLNRDLIKLNFNILKLAMESNFDILTFFGKKVKALRIERNISQEELAHRSKVHRTYIGMVERAEKNITLKNIEKIAKGLGVTIQDLFKVM